MHVRHLDMRGVMGSGENGDLVLEADGRQSRVGAQTICLNGASVVNYISNETLKSCPTQVRDMPQSDAPNSVMLYLDGNHHNRLFDRFAAFGAVFLPSNIAFVNLHASTQPIPAGTHHRPAKLLKLGPGRRVAFQIQYSLEPERVGPVLLSGQLPHRQEPNLQRLARALEKRSRGQPRLRMTVWAQQYITSCMPRLPRFPTVAAEKSVAPSQALKVALAVFFIAKELMKLGQVPRVVNPRLWAQVISIRHALSCQHRWREVNIPLALK